MPSFKKLFDSNVKCGQFPTADNKKGCGESNFTLKQYAGMMDLRDHKQFIAECLICGCEMSVDMDTTKGIIIPKLPVTEEEG